MNFLLAMFSVSDLLFTEESLLKHGFGDLLGAVNAAITLAYKRGLLDGFLAGCVLTMLMILPNKTQIVVVKGDSDGKHS